MDTTALSVWHSLLHSSPQQNALFNVLSPELSEKLKNASLSTDPMRGSGPLQDELAHVHFSWMTPFLRSLSETDIKLFLSSLTPEQMKGLKNALLLSNTIPSPSTLGKTYLRKTLFDQIASEDLAPVSCLSDHPLNCLLDLTTAEFTSLIELLSMHDLSVEIRQIIETSKLKEIYALLSKAQTSFLKTLLHKKEAV
ncbi:MAG: hypothetical protein HYX67_02360, partial [Candidatus Melainabacteria bacterium]|nr:hypothetical protein [Candidatus Melainabacteria bacterium]